MSKDKMTPEFYKTLPWRIASHKWLDCFYHITGIDGDRELKILSMNEGHHPIKEHRDRIRDNANAIVSAVNNTYGAGINPEAVPEMFDAIKEIDAIWGQEWGWEKHPAFLKAKAAIEKAKL